MKETVLFISMSLDGFIADKDGGVDWLQGQDAGAKTEDFYTPFSRTVDTVLMGRKTYEQIVQELSPQAWPYQGLVTYVLTSRPPADTEEVRFTDEDPARLVKALRQQPGKDIWICGGARLAQQLVGQDLVDRYAITIIPVILGGGIPLFAAGGPRIGLQLERSRSSNGLVELTYRRK